MEVHHHSHTARKKWTHYFWEFLMLFLAVFCGFLAEYQLEHKIEKEREKQFIQSLVSDLRDDTLRITVQISNLEKAVSYFDTLSRLLEDPEKARQNGDVIYYTSRMGIRSGPLVNNTRTIDQLRNAGGFRLIRSQETSGRIMEYYAGYPELRMVENLLTSENAAFKEVAARIMQQSVYREQISEDGSVRRISGNLRLLSYDEKDLNQLGFHAIQMNGSRRGMQNNLHQLKQKATELLAFLQKKYRLD